MYLNYTWVIHIYKNILCLIAFNGCLRQSQVIFSLLSFFWFWSLTSSFFFLSCVFLLDLWYWALATEANLFFFAFYKVLWWVSRAISGWHIMLNRLSAFILRDYIVFLNLAWYRLYALKLVEYRIYHSDLASSTGVQSCLGQTAVKYL